MSKINCVYCGQAFEFNRSPAGGPVKCPHRGSDNTVAASRSQTMHLPQIRPAAEREQVDFVVGPGPCKKRKLQHGVGARFGNKMGAHNLIMKQSLAHIAHRIAASSWLMLWLIFAGIGSPSTALGEVHLPHVFGSHMVFQGKSP